MLVADVRMVLWMVNCNNSPNYTQVTFRTCLLNHEIGTVQISDVESKSRDTQAIFGSHTVKSNRRVFRGNLW